MNNDLISREDLKEALAKEIKTNDMNLWLKILLVIDSVQTVEPDREFAKWVTKMIFDNQVEDFDFEMFSELACRKLEKMGLVEKTEDEWIKKGDQEE